MDILCCFLFLVFLSVWCCPFQFWTFYTVCTWQREVLGKNHFQFFALIHHFNTENRELRALCDQITDVFFFFFYFCSLKSLPRHVSWQKIYIHSSVLILRPQRLSFSAKYFNFTSSFCLAHDFLFPDIIILRIKAVSY